MHYGVLDVSIFFFLSQPCHRGHHEPEMLSLTQDSFAYNGVIVHAFPFLVSLFAALGFRRKCTVLLDLSSVFFALMATLKLAQCIVIYEALYEG